MRAAFQYVLENDALTCHEIDFYLTGQIDTCGMQNIIPLFSNKLVIGYNG